MAREMTNNTLLRFISFEVLVPLGAACMAGAVAFAVLADDVGEIEVSMDKSSKEMDEVKSSVNAMQVDIGKITSTQTHIQRDISRILTILDDNRRPRAEPQ